MATMPGLKRKTNFVLVACIALLAGIALSRLAKFPGDSWLVIALIPALLVLRRKSLQSLLILLLFCLMFGWWRGSIDVNKLQQLQALSGQKITVTAIAQTDAVYSDKGQLLFDASDVYLEEPAKQPLIGTFKVSGYGEPMVYRGDMVQLEGKMFTMRGSRQARMAYADIVVTGSADNWLYSMRRQFSAGMQNVLPEPAASLGTGLLIGQRNGLPDDVLKALTAAGLVHIVAVSGYNLTILTRAVQRMKLGRSAYQQLILSLVLIGGFILITGFSASIVRAAMVSGLGLIAWYFGRNIRPLVLIAVPAAITAFIKPLYLWSDIGWYLSFLAFFGVLVLAPLLMKRLLSSPKPKILTTILFETTAAQLMTAPLIAVIFTQVSLVGILANLLVVPLVPFAMLFSALASVAGLFGDSILSFLAYPAMWLLTYIVDVAKILSGVPHALASLTISWSSMAAIYGLFIFLSYVMWQKTKHKKTASLSG